MARRKAEEIAELEALKSNAKRAIDDIEGKIEELERDLRDDIPLSESDRVIRMPQQKPGRSKQDYATPMELIQAVEKRFGRLVHDLAAHKDNARCESFYSKEQDCFKQSWHQDFPKGNLWLNPEFANIGPYAKKCFEESREREGLIIMLTPASIGSEWFAEWVEHKALVIGLRPRISFDGKNPYPKDCMLSIYGRVVSEPQSSVIRYHAGFETWRWDKKEAA